MNIGPQIFWMATLALAVASVTWTITHEEILREPREYLEHRARYGRTLAERKFFFALTCEFCMSHYVGLLLLLITGFQMLYDDWRGYLLAFFGVVWTANNLMSLYGRLRLDIRRERVEIKEKEQELKERTELDKAA
jgi:hypothetical protein